MGRFAHALTSAETWTAVRVFVARGILATLVGLSFWAVLPALFGWNVSAITSGSMMPAIRPGRVVAASPIDHADIQAGQIITVVNPATDDGSLLTHRVVRIDDNGHLVTRGDANNVEDSTRVEPGDAWLGRLSIPVIGMPRLWMTEGNHALVAAAGLGVAALAVAAIDRPLLRRRRSDDDQPPARGGGRRAVEASAAALVVALVALPIGASAAAFTTTTATGVSIWTAAPPSVPGFGAFGDAVMANRPLFFYRFDDGGTSVAHDSTGNGNHAAFIGAPDVTFTGARPDEVPGNLAATFDGTQAIVPGGMLPQTDEFTFLSLVSLRDWSDWGERTTTLFELVTPEGSHLRAYLDNGDLHLTADGTPINDVQIGGHFIGDWHFLAVSVTADTVTVRYNELAPMVFDRPNAPVPSRLVIGTRGQPFDQPGQPGEDGFRGRLDDIAFFDRALNDAEISEMWSVFHAGR